MGDPPPEPDDSEKPPRSKAKRITFIVLHVLLHVIFISYFIAATVFYILYDKESSDCYPPKSPAPEEPAATNATNTNTTLSNTTTTTEEPTTTEAPAKSKWAPNILCDINWCHGYGFLIIMFVLFYFFWFYYWVFKPYVGLKLYNNYLDGWIDAWIRFSRKMLVSGLMLALVVILALAYLGYECRYDAGKAIGLLGPVTFILVGFALSKHHRSVPWRIVTHGVMGQLLLAIVCLRLTFGRAIFECAGEKVSRFLSFARHGALFVYGERICDDYVFAFAILAVVFFFSVIASIAYYLGWMQFVLNGFGYILQATVGTTVCESVNAAGNIFLGMSESPLLIRPYIYKLTKSELHCICTSGYASVSGTVLGAFVAFGASPAFLITASVMAAPGSLAFAKLFYPETEESQTRSDNIEMEKSPETSVLDAVASGAAAGLMIVLGIVSNIIAILSIFFFLDAVTEWTFELLGLKGITMLWLLAQVFVPIVFLMGVPYYDCQDIALIVAEKSLINEFVGYKHLGQLIAAGRIDARSAAIATFALCGFANPGSLGILIAALSAMAPTRRSDITQVAVRAYFAGSFVSFTSASFAGILIQESYKDNSADKFLAAGKELNYVDEVLIG